MPSGTGTGIGEKKEFVVIDSSLSGSTVVQQRYSHWARSGT